MTSLLYQAYQNHADLTEPWRTGALQALKYLNLLPQGMSDKFFRRLAAAQAADRDPGQTAFRVEEKARWRKRH